MARISVFFKGVAKEMRKTSWPKRSELVKSTITVIVTVVIVGVILALVDAGFTYIFEKVVG